MAASKSLVAEARLRGDCDRGERGIDFRRISFHDTLKDA
jgi:hypothetical protein